MSTDTVPIPEVPGLPFLGSALDIDFDFPLGTFLKFAEKHGELYRIRFPGREVIHVTTQALAHELFDESRFQKDITAALGEVKNAVHDGLFTALLHDQNWGIAHRILVPAFGPMAIQSMFPEMHEIGTQLALKWARHGPNTPIMVTDDFTRLALDTLALCSMDFRFNSFSHDELHPFITAMGDFLKTCGSRVSRPKMVTALMRTETNKYWADIETMRSTAEGIVKARKAHPTRRRDLLSAMLDGADPKTGQKLSDESIMDNLITFLIAGHETTGGMLSFASYQLLKNPEKYHRARQEVDNVIGTGAIKVEHMSKLPYLTAVLRETLRLRIPLIVGGKYFVKKGQQFGMLVAKIHLDPKVYGETVHNFIPERMIDEAFEKRNKEFPDCWKPFGNGVRGCIGRDFAWQEALVALAMMLQNFDLSMDDPTYKLQFKQTLTTKPKNFYMRAAVRGGLTATELSHRLSGTAAAPVTNGVARGTSRPGGTKNEKQRQGKPMSIYYGSNTGTCEAFAQRLAADANLHGYEATIVDTMDAAKGKLASDGPVVIITASYEGQPPDNAGVFCEWLTGLQADELQQVSYAVFGCGSRHWTQTFHRIPKLVDDTMAARGGSRICPLGLADAAKGEMFAEFEQWEDEVFWPAISAKYGSIEESNAPFNPSLAIQFSFPRFLTLHQDVKEAVVVSARVLTALGASQKNHLEISLPVGMTYQTGDYLAVLPVNPAETVNRAMRRFSLAWDTTITITADCRTTLPTNTPVRAHDVLSSYVELSQPATKRGILALTDAAPDPPTKAALSLLPHPLPSLPTLLSLFPTIPLPLTTFLALLPPMRPRQYSISSSPLHDPSRATLTFSLISSPLTSTSTNANDTTPPHIGIASTHLASLLPGSILPISIRPAHPAFRLPSDPETTPIIMIAAGSGIAPFRAFIQERATQMGMGRTLADAVLFYGCRGPGEDLYREEMDAWEGMGVVRVRRAYSRAAGETEGCRYVQERVWRERGEVWGLWGRGAKVFVCGGRGMEGGVRGVVVGMAREGEGEGADEAWGGRWFEGVRNGRYVVDVFD
ncbi:putative bifunctional P-450:NADPH-P450 reductase [Podospora conica]|nr:putative bifunctional P-450:NADPH-P450 reductase [Schizothecium conicum]